VRRTTRGGELENIYAALAEGRTKVRSVPPVCDEASVADEAIRPYLTLREVADLIGYSRWTLYHWIREGRLTPDHGLRRIGRSVRVEWSVFKAAWYRGDLE